MAGIPAAVADPATASPRRSGARAVLLGTGVHDSGSDLPDIASVSTTLSDVERALVDRCGFGADQVRVACDPATPIEMAETIAYAAEDATDLLIVYYVGHGLVSPSGMLHLAARMTDRRPTRLPHTGLPYATIRQYLLESPARSLVVVLDCCFSGTALQGLSDPEDEMVNLAEIAGAFVLTSSGRDEVSLAPEGARHTAFSGALLDLLTGGDPDGSAELTLSAVHRHLARALPAAGLPRPRCRVTGGVGGLVLAANPAYRQPAPVPYDGPTLPAPPADARPYKGLAPFDESDAMWFHGRERVTAALVRRLADRYDDPGPLVVTGASGSGKSSLVRAGLIPAVARGDLGIAGSAQWPRLVLTPSADPVGAIARAVEPLVGVAGELLADQIRRDPPRLGRVLRWRLDREGAGSRVLLVVDQFEEIFTQCADEEERRLFVAVLHASAESAALVVLTVRADFYGESAAYPELRGSLEGRQLLVGPMAADEVRAAIEKPAAAAGLSLEPGLTAMAMRDLGLLSGRDGYEAGRLPLLAHALYVTWLQREESWLTVAGYERGGGIHGALAVTGEQALSRLDGPGQETARLLLLRLIRIGEGSEDTRRRVERQRLLSEMPDPATASVVLAAFTADDTRLITVDEDSVTITHEALLTAWPRLRSWIEADHAGLVVEQQLVESATDWDREGREPAALLRGSRLGLVRDWATDAHRRARLGGVAREYLDAALRQEAEEQRGVHRRARARVAVTAALAVLLVLSLVSTLVARGQRDTAVAQRRAAAVRSLTAQAELLRGSQIGLAMRLGMSAVALDPTPDARASLAETASQSHYAGVIAGNSGPISAVAYAPDGRTLLTGGADKTASLWDVTEPARPRRLAVLAGHQGAVLAAAFSPDGRFAVTGGADKAVLLWDVADRTHPRRLATLSGNGGEVGSVAFTLNGNTVVVGSPAGQGTFWDVSDHSHPRQVAVLPGGDSIEAKTAVSPDGRVALLAADDLVDWDDAGSGDATVALYDISRPAHPVLLNSFDTGQLIVTAVAYGSDGRTIAVAGNDNTVTLWSVAQPEHPRRLGTLTGHTGTIEAVAFSRDGLTLAAASMDQTAVLWDVTDRRHPMRLATLTGHSDPVADVAFDPDGRLVATAGADGNVMMWSITPPDAPARLGSLYTYASGDERSSAAFSPDGRIVLIGTHNSQISFKSPGYLFDVTDPAAPRRISLLRGRASINKVAFSADGHTVATGNSDFTTTVWDVADLAHPRSLLNLPSDGDSTGGISFAPDGGMLATESASGKLTLWNVADATRPIRLLTVATGPTPSGLAFSPDGRTVVIGSTDNTATLWDVSRPTAVHRVGVLNDQDSVLAVAFGPDGRTVATGTSDSTVLWDVADPTRPRVLATLLGQSGAVNAVAFSADGETVAVGSKDRTVSLWNIANPTYPRRIELFSDHTKPVSAVAFNPAGTILLTAGDDDSVMENLTGLKNSVTQPLARTCALIGQGLDPAEWSKYAPGVQFRAACPRNEAVPVSPVATLVTAAEVAARGVLPQSFDLPAGWAASVASPQTPTSDKTGEQLSSCAGASGRTVVHVASPTFTRGDASLNADVDVAIGPSDMAMDIARVGNPQYLPCLQHVTQSADQKAAPGVSATVVARAVSSPRYGDFTKRIEVTTTWAFPGVKPSKTFAEIVFVMDGRYQLQTQFTDVRPIDSRLEAAVVRLLTARMTAAG